MNINKPDWTKPPIADVSPEFKFPEVDDQLLENGIRLINVDDDTQENVVIKFLVEIGSYNEAIPGLVDVSSKLLTRGTDSRSAVELFDISESLGASIKSNSSWNNTSISVTGLSKYTEKYFELMTDCLKNSQFHESEFNRVIAKQTADIQQNSSDTNYLAQVALNYELFKGHPYGHSRLGSENSIKHIELQQCKDWYGSFKNSWITVIAAGTFDKAELIDLIEAIEHTPQDNEHNYPEVDIPKDEFLIIDKKDAPQSSLRVGFPTIGKEHVDYPAFQFANTIFGGYFMSRLNHNLRETKGYTYGVHSQISTLKGSSNLIIHSNIGNDYIQDSINEIKKEMALFADEGITDEELIRAKQYILGSFARSYETISQQSMMLSNLSLFSLDLDYYENYFNSIKNLDESEINRVIKKYFQPKGMIFAAAGDRTALEKQMSGFGELKFYSPEGLITK